MSEQSTPTEVCFSCGDTCQFVAVNSNTDETLWRCTECGMQISTSGLLAVREMMEKPDFYAFQPPVGCGVMLDTLSYLAYHLYTLDSLSRCTCPLRWSVLRQDIRDDFYARAGAAYKDWHALEIDSIEARKFRRA